MGCKDKRKLPLVQITSQDLGRTSRPPNDVEDFVCGDCGTALPRRPQDYFHFPCNKSAPVEWRDRRQAICDDCPTDRNQPNGDGVPICLTEKEAHPERDCVITEGVKKHWAYCKDRHWGKVGMICPNCKRQVFHGKRAPTHCPYCKWSSFSPADGTVGFIGPTYLEIGGTETWHQTLLPRLGGVAGYVVINEDHATGNPESLGVPFGIGLREARQLAKSSETLVVWGLTDWELTQILGKLPKKRVIAVAHCDDRSDWTVAIMRELSRWATDYVYLEPNGINAVPAERRKDAVLIRNGINEERISPTKSREEIREKLGITPRQKMLLMVTRISEEKGVDVVARAVEYLPEDYVLVIAGQVQLGGELYFHGLPKSDRIKYLPPVEKPGDLLCAADALINASEFEGSGLSMIEAMMAGVPLIATPAGVIESRPELAAIVPHGSTPQAWATAIVNDFVRLIEQLRRAYNATQLMREVYSADRFVEGWRLLLKR